MERPSNPVWQQRLRTVEPVLESFNFRLASEALHYSSFGSAEAVYERSDMRIELFWDGRENWIDAHYALRNRNERHLCDIRQTLAVEPPKSNVLAHVLRPGVVADEYIANLVLAIERIAAKG